MHALLHNQTTVTKDNMDKEKLSQNDTMEELRIRNVPMELRRRIGMAAQQQGLSISAYVTELLNSKVPEFRKKASNAA